MNLECPYCKSELMKGSIDRPRCSLQWHDENMSILEKIGVVGGEILTEKMRIKCYRCRDCHKIIIDLNQL